MAKLTDELVDKICAEIAQGIAINEACALVGISRKVLGAAVDGDDPAHPEWRLKKDKAKATAIKHYFAELKRYADGNEGKGNQAGVKAVQSILMALDSRFRKEHQEAVRGLNITINVLGGNPNEPIAVEARLIPQDQLPPGAKGE